MRGALVCVLVLVLLFTATSAKVSFRHPDFSIDELTDSIAQALFENNVNEMAKLLVSTGKDNQAPPPGWKVVHTYREAHDKNKVFVNENTKQVVISYGGTEPTVGDWAKNFDVGKQNLKINGKDYGGVHSGFLKQFQRTEKEMFGSAMPYVKAGYKLEITGHSQGGAVGTIASVYAKEKYGIKDPQVVTFGSPSVGDAKFASSYNSRIPDNTRVVNTYKNIFGQERTDAVPHVPLPVMGFKHVGNEKKVSTGRGDFTSGVLNHLMPNYERATRNNPVLDKQGPIASLIAKGPDALKNGIKQGVKGAANMAGMITKGASKQLKNTATEITNRIKNSKLGKQVTTGAKAVANKVKAAGKKVQSAAKNVASRAKSVVNKARNTVKNAANRLRNTASNVVNRAKTTAKNVASRVKNTARNVASRARSVANQAKSTVRNVANKARGAARNVASKVRSSVRNGVNKAKGAVRNVASRARNTAKNVANRARSTVKNVASRAKNVASRARNTARNVVNKAKGTVRNVASRARNTARNVASRAKNTARNVASRAKSTVKRAGSAVRNVANKARGAARTVAAKARSTARNVASRASSAARNLASRTRSVASKARSAVRNVSSKARSTARNVASRASSTARRVSSGVRSTVSRASSAVRSVSSRASSAARSVSSRASSAVRSVGSSIRSAFRA